MPRGSLLATPYLAKYTDMMVLAIPVAFLVRIGLKTKAFAGSRTSGTGRRAFSSPIVPTATPTGLAATLIGLNLSSWVVPVPGGGVEHGELWLR